MNTSVETQAAGDARALPQISSTTSICCCFALSVLYVASLYVWKSKHDRDHPSSIKRRFCSVFVVMLISPLFVYTFSAPELLLRVPFLTLLGIRWKGLWQSITIPYLLTVLLFLGPLFVQMQQDAAHFYFDAEYWKSAITNIIWLRNHVVAPITEEFVFRACMMPLILQSFTPQMSVFLTPLFFGIAHVHHTVERLNLGVDLGTAVLIAIFQFFYTTLFGFYSAYLFARTGHLLAPFLIHAFCNHMGLPDVQDLWQQTLMRRILSIIVYFIGFLSWIMLLPIATEPSLYENDLFWNI